jgi:hypothetical protein
MHDDDREILKAKLDEIEAGIRTLASLRRTVSQPFDEGIGILEAHRDEMLEAHDAEIAGRCGSCEKLLLAGEQGNAHFYADESEMIFCAECAPCWGDIKTHWEEFPADAADEEQVEMMKTALEGVATHLAAGGKLEDKILNPLEAAA